MRSTQRQKQIAAICLSAMLCAVLAGCSKEQLGRLVLGEPNTGPLPPNFLGPSTDIFPLQVAYRSLFLQGSGNNLTVTGACTGFASMRFDVAAPEVYEGIAGFGSFQHFSYSTPSCQQLNLPLDKTWHVDSRYAPAGESSAGREHGVLVGAVMELPLTIRLYDSMTYATLALYTDATRAVPLGTRTLSYTTEVDTLVTVLLVITARDYDNTGALKRVRTDTFRLHNNGELSLRAIDFQDFSSGQVVNMRVP